MAGLDPAIHAALLRRRVGTRPPKGAEERTGSALGRDRADGDTWMAGSSPAMTVEGGWPPETSAGLIERRAERATRQAILGPEQVERGDDSGDFFIGRAARVDSHDSRLVRRRLLQRVELAAEQGGRHILVMACGDAGRDQRFGAFYVDEASVRPGRTNAIAISALKRRAGQYARLPCGGPA